MTEDTMQALDDHIGTVYPALDAATVHELALICAAAQTDPAAARQLIDLVSELAQAEAPGTDLENRFLKVILLAIIEQWAARQDDFALQAAAVIRTLVQETARERRPAAPASPAERSTP